MCSEECQTANNAFGALPNAKELACCDCGEGAAGSECKMRKMKLETACGVRTDCIDTNKRLIAACIDRNRKLH